MYNDFLQQLSITSKKSEIKYFHGMAICFIGKKPPDKRAFASTLAHSREQCVIGVH